MFYIFLLSVVLFYVMFFSLAAMYIRQGEAHSNEGKWAWLDMTH